MRGSQQYAISNKMSYQKRVIKKDYELLSGSVIDPKLRSIIMYDLPKTT